MAKFFPPSKRKQSGRRNQRKSYKAQRVWVLEKAAALSSSSFPPPSPIAMFFSRALFSFFAVGAISAFAAPSPALVEKREDISDVLATLDTLEKSNDAIIPQIGELLILPSAVDVF
jgi:hypothetical protein